MDPLNNGLLLDFLKVTEKAAISASNWTGKGDKIAADKAAVDAMRTAFNLIDFKGKVVIGEGEKDEAPMLYTGEELGSGKGEEMDIAIDPLECTSFCAKGLPNSMSVLAASPKGTLLSVPGTYMDQFIVPEEAKGRIDINDSVENNLRNIAKALGKQVNELTIAAMDRERSRPLIEEVQALGAKIHLIKHGTVSAALNVILRKQGLDAMWTIGGAPEAILVAAALKSIGGDMQAVLKPHNPEFEEDASRMGFNDLDKVFKLGDLAKSQETFFIATGVTSGSIVKGIERQEGKIKTNSIVLNGKEKSMEYVTSEYDI